MTVREGELFLCFREIIRNNVEPIALPLGRITPQDPGHDRRGEGPDTFSLPSRVEFQVVDAGPSIPLTIISMRTPT